MDLTLLIPVYNEEESVEPLYEGLVRAVSPLDLSFEILFVDDGSEDDTFRKLKALASMDPRLRVIKLKRNLGQTPATVVGFERARGRILITLDGDLQNDPADIPKFLKELDSGFDIIVGWRFDRQDKFLTRVLPSKIANRIISWITGISLHDTGCSFRAYRTELICKLPLYSDMHRFIPAMTSLTGAKIKEIKIRHNERRFGTSKYGIFRIYKVLLDLIVVRTLLGVANDPLFLFMRFGLLFMSLGIAVASFVLVTFLTQSTEFGTVFLIVGFLFASLGVFLVSTGLLIQLVYGTGSKKILSLSTLTSRIHDAPSRAGSSGGS